MLNPKATEATTAQQKSVVPYIALFGISAILLWLGVFMLHEWAEAAAYGHAVQHLVIFASGNIMGVTLLGAYRRRKH